MSNFKINLNLKNLEGAFLFNFQGRTETKKCICIPVDDNKMYVSDKTGAVRIDLVAFENKTPLQSGATHLIKRSLSKVEIQSMTSDQRKQQLLLGDMTPMIPQQVQQPMVQQPIQQPSQGNEELPF